MAVSVAPTESNILAALRAFLLGILPAGTKVIQGQTNRVPEPSDANYAVFWPLRQVRLATNIDDYIDAAFTASIAADLMTVTGGLIGVIEAGHQVFGTGLAAGTTTIVAQVSGTLGGIGTYTVSQAQTVPSQKLAAGAATFLQKTMLTFQIDVHGPDSANHAQVISTLFRDPYAVERFAESGYDVVPLYADDPRQMPFINENQQYENRWVVEANMQGNEVVSGISQQFADALAVGLVSVDAVYPAT